MDGVKLKEALKDNSSLSYSTISMVAIANIMKFVVVSLEMDMKTLDYYYKIDVESLLNSAIPDDEIETLQKQGWSFTEDNKSLVLYLKS